MSELPVVAGVDLSARPRADDYVVPEDADLIDYEVFTHPDSAST